MRDITRRGMLSGTGALLGVAAVAGCSSPKAASPTAAPTTSGTGATGGGTPTGSLELKAGALADVPVGGAKLVTIDGHDLILTQPTAGQPAVFVNRCTHQGCKVDISGQKLLCPCHGSTFAFDGKVLSGSLAKDPLHEGKLRLENGQIIVEQA